MKLPEIRTKADIARARAVVQDFVRVASQVERLAETDEERNAGKLLDAYGNRLYEATRQAEAAYETKTAQK